MKTRLFVFVFILCLSTISPAVLVQAASNRLSGRILLDVERNGEAWYVNPTDNRRYYLGRPADAFQVMRRLGLGITERDFQRIAQEGMPVDGDRAFAQRLAGRIIIRVEYLGEAWYVNPIDLKKYYLGRPEDAFALMRRLGLGISLKDLAMIHKPGTSESIDQYSAYERRIVKTSLGDFDTDIMTVDLNDPDLEIITDTAMTTTCKSSCQAKPLLDYVRDNNGTFAAINATYFDTSAAKRNYYFYPVYNTREKVLINDDQLKYWTTGPILAFDTNNKIHYFKSAVEFKSLDNFESSREVKLQAALGNKPRLVEGGMDVLIGWDMDKKQMEMKLQREAVGFKDNKLYMVVTRKANLNDLAAVMKALGVDTALNLDGGMSSALFYNGEMMVGPGRDIPNALLFRKKNAK